MRTEKAAWLRTYKIRAYLEDTRHLAKILNIFRRYTSSSEDDRHLAGSWLGLEVSATRPAPRGVWRVTTVRWRCSHGAALLPHTLPTLCHDGTCHSTLHQFPPSYLPPCALIASRAGLDSEARAAREVHGVLGRACPRLLALGSAVDTLALESHMPTKTRRCVRWPTGGVRVAGMRCNAC